MSQCNEALISVRLVVMDHYMSQPIPTLDPLTSQFRGYSIKKVPVIRIFGSTPAGQRACLHLHGIFPYIYIPMPDNEGKGFVYRLASSLDKAINISMQQGSSNIQHVYKAVKVTGRPMYGYHPRQHNFVKIFFYNPQIVKRAAELLAGGAVMNQILQPHESHIGTELQFMMDYNLQGMNYIHLRHAVFRQGKLHDEYDDILPFIEFKKKKKAPPHHTSKMTDVNISSFEPNYMDISPKERIFDMSELAESLKLPAEVVRQSCTELELDAVAADILNHNDLSEGGMNPGLQALWSEERERRIELCIDDPLEAPDSPPRSQKSKQTNKDSEQLWKLRLNEVVEQRRLAEGGSSQVSESSDPDATVNMSGVSEKLSGKENHPRIYPAESSELEEQRLPAATHVEDHVASLSQTVLDTSVFSASMQHTEDDTEDGESSLGDITIVDEDVIATQMSLQSSLKEDDLELADLLADLATEAEVEGNEKTGQNSSQTTSQMTPTKMRSRRPSSAKKIAEDEEDELESLEMSQIVWDIDPATTAYTENLLEAASNEDDWHDMNKTMMEEMAREMSAGEESEDMFDD